MFFSKNRKIAGPYVQIKQGPERKNAKNDQF